jgi:hypothetical protein
MTELDKLEQYLKEHGYIFTRKTESFPEEIFSRNPNEHDLYAYFHGVPWLDQIIVYDEDGTRLWDAVCHRGSYGAEQGLIEVMGDTVTEKDVEGWLTAEDIIGALEGRNDLDD